MHSHKITTTKRPASSPRRRLSNPPTALAATSSVSNNQRLIVQMAEHFFDRPIINSPYNYPGRHWELDADGQPTSRIIDARRRSELITPVPKPKKSKKKVQQQQEMLLDSGGASRR
jgi:hypothetical protein